MPSVGAGAANKALPLCSVPIQLQNEEKKSRLGRECGNNPLTAHQCEREGHSTQLTGQTPGLLTQSLGRARLVSTVTRPLDQAAFS